MPQLVAEPWPEAEALFRSDPRWLGGDACYSVDLGGDRILWLFGDSFIATSDRRDRRESRMVRNSIGLQHGRDPTTAAIALLWRSGADGSPAPFFADSAQHGFWPLHGIRLDEGPLLLFQTLVRSTPGEGLGFAIDGWRVLRIPNPHDLPDRWVLEPLPMVRLPFRTMMGTAVWREGAHLLALGTTGESPHAGLVCRCAVADLLAGIVDPQWWNGTTFGPPLDHPGPVPVMAEAGPENSVHFDTAHREWLHVHSLGFGETTIAVRAAFRPTGPWSAPVSVYTPPESRAPRPLVYAAKAHPELAAGPGALAVTYAANAWDFADLFTERGQRELYWPRFVRLMRR